MRGLVSPLALWMLAPLTRLAGGSLAGMMGPVNSTCWLHIWNVRLFKLQHGA